MSIVLQGAVIKFNKINLQIYFIYFNVIIISLQNN